MLAKATWKLQGPTLTPARPSALLKRGSTPAGGEVRGLLRKLSESAGQFPPCETPRPYRTVPGSLRRHAEPCLCMHPLQLKSAHILKLYFPQLRGEKRIKKNYLLADSVSQTG